MKKTPLIIIIIATTLFVGLMNTVFIRTEDVGSWKNYIGYAFLAIAFVNSIFFIRSKLTKTPNQ